MDKIKSNSSVEIYITLTVNESEARALEAITAYGSESFLKVFYEKMGKTYLQPHEKGVVSLFKTIKQELPSHLKKATDARDIFKQ